MINIKKIALVVGILALSITGCKKSNKLAPTNFKDLFKGDWNTPGLYEKDGKEHVLNVPSATSFTGMEINVMDFTQGRNILNNPAEDSQSTFKRAIDNAEPGDKIIVPEGKFYFRSSGYSNTFNYHIKLPTGVALIGAGEDKTFLVSNYTTTENESSETSTILVANAQKVMITGLTVTAATEDSELPPDDNQSIQSNVFTAPRYGIAVVTKVGSVPKESDESKNILIENVTVEKFQRMGIRLARTQDVLVNNCTFQKAVNLASGGMGYGVNIQAEGPGVNLTDKIGDSKFNVVQNSKFIGGWLRHGIVVQYFSHNNLIKDNTFTDALLDSIDLHGEEEYSNEVVGNTFTNMRKGAAVGIGNTGATHSKSGRNNYIHNNTIDGGLRGIDISEGSNYAIIENNIIKNMDKGIVCSNSNYSYIIGNKITNTAKTAIEVTYTYIVLDPGAGVPKGYFIQNNEIDKADVGIYVEVNDKLFTVAGNTFKNITTKDYQNDSDSFILPDRSTLMDPVTGDKLKPIQSNFVESGSGNTVQTQKNMKLKTSATEPNNNRVAYALFDTTSIGNNYSKVYLTITAKAMNGTPTINIWSNITYTDWSASTITWNNSKLHESNIAYEKSTTEDPIEKFHDFQFPIKDYNMHSYFLDVTEAYNALKAKSSKFTLMFIGDRETEDYMEVYSGEQNNDQAMGLIFA